MLALTVDIDWAPDWMVARMAATLEAHGVPATWFCTHASPALARLRERPDLFELGVHPNFLPGSTHGAAPAEVLDHVMAIVPEAVSARAHCFVQSSLLLVELRRRTPVRIDSSTFLPDVEGLRPVRHRTAAGEVVRIPATWCDDYEPERPRPDWRLERLLGRPGVSVAVFHPARVCLNIATAADYARLKPLVGAGERLAEADAEPLPGEGPGPAFARLVERLADTGAARRLRDLA
jgi:peptidoglycan/xylan/chitin deacetylase (PgdA/CDA1 family)